MGKNKEQEFVWEESLTPESRAYLEELFSGGAAAKNFFDAPEIPKNESSNTLTALSQRYYDVTNEIEAAEKALSELKSEKSYLNRQLVDAMLSEGLQAQKWDYGTISLINSHHVNVAVANEGNVLTWAENVGFDWLIRKLDKDALKEFILELPKGDDGKTILPPEIAPFVKEYNQTTVRLVRK